MNRRALLKGLLTAPMAARAPAIAPEMLYSTDYVALEMAGYEANAAAWAEFFQAVREAADENVRQFYRAKFCDLMTSMSDPFGRE